MLQDANRPKIILEDLRQYHSARGLKRVRSHSTMASNQLLLPSRLPNRRVHLLPMAHNILKGYRLLHLLYRRIPHKYNHRSQQSLKDLTMPRNRRRNLNKNPKRKRHLLRQARKQETSARDVHLRIVKLLRAVLRVALRGALRKTP